MHMKKDKKANMLSDREEMLPSMPDLAVELILHGTEGTDLGGPSVRVTEMVGKLAEFNAFGSLGWTTDNDVRISHIFNVWSPHTCIESVQKAKAKGNAVVLSSIFLNLSDYKIYEELVPALYDGLKGTELTKTLNEVKEHTSKDRDIPIFEPVEGYYTALGYIIDQVDYLVLLSDYERRCLEGVQALRSTPYKIIHNPAQQIKCPVDDPTIIRERMNLDQFFLQIGRIEPRKNQLLLAECARRLNVPAVFLGAESDPVYANLVRKVAGPMGVFPGRVSHDDPLFAAFLGNTLALCVPSWAEGAPLVALEGAGVGAQLILSDQSGEIEYFGDRASYVNPADINAMMMNMEAAMKRGGPLRDAGLINMAARDFDWDSHIQQTLDVYRSL